MSLSWTKNSTSETGFKIARKDEGSFSYPDITTTGAGIVNYVNTGLATGKTYYYKVKAFNATAESAYSTEAKVTLSAAPAIVPEVTNVIASPNPAGNDGNSIVTVTFSVSVSANIKAVIYNLKGNLVSTIDNIAASASSQNSFTWNVANVPPGIYMYKFKSSTQGINEIKGATGRIIVKK